MVQNLDFNVPYTFEVKKENISGLVFDIEPKQADGTTICDVADLNEISVDLVLRDSVNNKNKTLFSGYLDTLLTGMYAQTTKYSICVQKRTKGYKVTLSFGNYPIDTNSTRFLILKVKIQNTAFTSCVTANSKAIVETIPSPVQNHSGLVPVIESHFIGNNQNSFDEPLGDNVVSVVVAQDFANTYDASAISVESVELTDENGFNKSVTENVLVSENLDLLSVNPDTAIKQLVAYRNLNHFLHGARLKAKFNSVVDATAQVITVKLERPF